MRSTRSALQITLQSVTPPHRTTPTMFSADGILGRDFSIITAGMDGISMRQQVHAENIANVDTEGYKARTVDFENVLSHALTSTSTDASNGAGGSGFGSAVAGAQGGADNLSSHFTTSIRRGAAGHVDGTQETSEMMNDNVRYRVLSQQVTNRLQELKGVISEMGRG